MDASFTDRPFGCPPSVIIQIDGPPKGKARPRFNGKTGTTYTPKTTKLYEQAIQWAARSAMRDRKVIVGPCILTVDAFFPVPASWGKAKREAALAGVYRPATLPDCDNVMKSALDGLNRIVYADDRQVIEATVRKHYSDRPRIRIEVEERL